MEEGVRWDSKVEHGEAREEDEGDGGVVEEREGNKQDDADGFPLIHVCPYKKSFILKF